MSTDAPAADARPLVLSHDVVRADLPPGIILDSAHGRMFRCVELTEGQKREVFRETPGLDEREAVITGVRGGPARQLCTELRTAYDQAAIGVGRVLDGTACRYAVRVGSSELQGE